MAIKKLTADTLPPRRWAIVAFPIAGKSTFSTRMRGPLIVADIDGRYTEVHSLAKEEVGVIQIDGRGDASDANVWADQITKDIAGQKFGTLIADSITPVIEPLFYDAAQQDGATNRNKSLLHKAATANHFFNALVRHGNDVLLVWHLKDTVVNGDKKTRTTLSAYETERLKMHLNAILEIVIDEKSGKRGIEIVWARNGRDGATIWDDSGSWIDMPEKIEAHLYAKAADNTAPAAAPTATAPLLPPAAPPVAEAELPESPVALFADRNEALKWGVDQGAYPDLTKALDAYEAVKKKDSPKSAGDMFQLWRAHVASALKVQKVA